MATCSKPRADQRSAGVFAGQGAERSLDVDQPLLFSWNFACPRSLHDPSKIKGRGEQGCGIKVPTSVIQGNPPLYDQNSLWESLSVVSQKWIPFPTALVESLQGLRPPRRFGTPEAPKRRSREAGPDFGAPAGGVQWL